MRPELADKVMPFGDHLEELRRRLILALWGLAPILVGSLIVGKTLLRIILQPMLAAMNKQNVGGSMMVTAPFENFNTYLKISFILALIVGAPWILYQLWQFVAPGLYPNERRFAYLLAPMSAILTVAGLLFMYFAMLPMVLAFFVRFNASMAPPPVPVAPIPAGVSLPSIPTLEADPPSPQPGQMWIYHNQLRIAVPPRDKHGHAATPPTAPTSDAPPAETPAATPHPPVILSVALTANSLISQHYKISEYLGTVLGFALAFAIGFQTPVVVLLLGWAGITTPAGLSKYRRYAIFACAVAGALLTPSDPFSMFILAVPLYLLYEGGIVLLRLVPAEAVAEGRIFSRRKKPAPAPAAPAAPSATADADAPENRPDDQ